MEVSTVKVYIKVVPQAKYNKIEKPILNEDGNMSMKVRVTASAIDGKANRALVGLLADYFHLKKSQIEIASGHTSRQKLIKLFEVDKSSLIDHLQLKLL